MPIHYSNIPEFRWFFDDVAWGSESVAILEIVVICAMGELAGVLHTFVKTDLFVRRDRPLRGLILIVEGFGQGNGKNKLLLTLTKIPVKLEKTAEGVPFHFEDGAFSHTASQLSGLLAAVKR